MLKIRKAEITDLPAITDIYNDAILTTTATFDTEAKTAKEQKKWFAHHDKKHPVIVGELGGKVVGWASISAWSDRCAYARTGELSLYIDKKHQGKGYGRRLFEAIVEAGRKLGYHTVLSRVTEGNEISFHLHESLGFKKIGIMEEVGEKFGKLLNVHLFQKIY